uniref:Uncharacterized protein n=1 Tax=Anguilla anguilla TaxID=7936 RepID=A0A0E9TWT1_ANGAN
MHCRRSINFKYSMHLVIILVQSLHT